MDKERKWRKNPGPWDKEPDEFTFTHAGYQCDMQRNHSGSWCGYVLLPEQHPLHGIIYSEKFPKKFDHLWQKKKNSSIDLEKDIGIFNLICGDKESPNIDLAIHAHGGLTFSGKHKDGRWIFGFDCAHAWDLSPNYDTSWRTSDQIYRDFEYVKDNCKRLADQLKEVQDSDKET